jgi:hypothetical protein
MKGMNMEKQTIEHTEPQRDEDKAPEGGGVFSFSSLTDPGRPLTPGGRGFNYLRNPNEPTGTWPSEKGSS